ncbi:MAG: 3-dehydroquinate synthase [Chloroflexi bacterium]|nr:3-dehydroquinate synthase [Chloroflexota bacterium]
MTGLIFLVGLSGTGKSTIGRLLSGRLQLPFVDTDVEIERRAGKSVAAIFADEGESVFRQLESDVLRDVSARRAGVVATGGGAPTDPSNRTLIRAAGPVFWLDATAETIARRLGDGAALRPLLQGDVLASLERLRSLRVNAYQACGTRIETQERSPFEIADEIVRELRSSGYFAPAAWTDGLTAPVWVNTSGHSYPIYVGSGLVERFPEILQRHGLEGRLHCLIDKRVASLHGAAFASSLKKGDTWHPTEAGETQKTLAHTYELYDELLAERPERSDTLVAIGGGVVGDLVGFLASTLLRGMRFVQIPTTVLAQVDSSVGGKVGVDHPRGKNLIGSFYQPCLVLADLDVLGTLPPREIAAGLAEVVKIAVVQDADLFDQVEASAESLSALDREAMEPTIRRAIELKANLVEQDERDVLGIRALLNYGHTLGHAIEAATDYGRFLHGEAVAVGMTAAGRMAAWMGGHPAEAVERQDGLLRRLGLPVSAASVPRERIKDALGLDKKRQAGNLTWIIPTGLGSARSGVEVPGELVDRVMDWVFEGPS